MAEYTPKSDYKKQGGTRIVKHLIFPVHTETKHPLMPGQLVRQEKLFKRGETIPEELLDDYNLERGERLGSFYTDAELQGEVAAAAEATQARRAAEAPPSFSELGEAELANYIIENKPNVDETVAMAAGDPDTARRLLEAESMATGGDPRAGVVKGLNKVIEAPAED